MGAGKNTDRDAPENGSRRYVGQHKNTAMSQHQDVLQEETLSVVIKTESDRRESTYSGIL